MKLFEVLKPLLENKVDYITEDQWLKVFLGAYMDDSMGVHLIVEEEVSSIAPSGTADYSLYLADLTDGGSFHSLKPEHILKFDEEHPNDVFKIMTSRVDTHRLMGLSQRYSSPTLEGLMKNFVHDLLEFMVENVSKKHLQWLVNRYQHQDFDLGEDHQMIKRVLDIYDRVRKETDIPQLTKKINYQELFEELHPFIEAEESEVRDAREQRLIANGELEIPFYKDKDEYVAIPQSFEASYHISEPNGWCTQEEYWYNSYTRDDQTLYFFRHKGKPYLVHFESEQFMGRANKPFNVNEMASESEAFRWILENVNLMGRKLEYQIKSLVILKESGIEYNIDEILMSASNIEYLYNYRGIIMDWFRSGEVSESLVRLMFETGIHEDVIVNSLVQFLEITDDNYEWAKNLVIQPNRNRFFEDNRFVIMAELLRNGHVSEEWFKEHYVNIRTTHAYYHVLPWKLVDEGKLSHEWVESNFGKRGRGT